MNQFLSGIDRGSLIKGTAIYLVVYAVLNACGGVALGILGGLAAGAGLAGATTGLSDTSDAVAASNVVAALGGLAAVIGLLYLLSVPVFAITAWGLWQRKAWSRTGAVIALGFSLILSLLTLNTGIGGILWVIISGIGVYLYLSDEGIKRELSQ